MDWITIDEFPNYEVNYEGRVLNKDSGHTLSPSVNQRGILQVGLMKQGVQHKRSVALLVAKAFLGEPDPPTFNSPIHLNGDKTDCHMDNLMWRPRWFAVKYHQQFTNGKRGFRTPVIEENSKMWFPSSWEAAIKFGLLDREIMLATLNRTYVWPTYQTFRQAD